ncbi:MAG TPA: hypothetical protein VGR82_03135 [Methylomirabilota bacterium]|nr:hypothetical protein [Methylomirabilota bacterium]
MPPTPKGWTFMLCPDHMLEALGAVRQQLADSMSSLERASNRAVRVADRAA